MFTSIIQAIFFSNSVKNKRGKKKRQRFYDLLNAEASGSFFVYSIQSKELFLLKKSFLRKRGSGRLNKKRKEGFLTALTTAIKKDPTTSIRKHEKTARTAIKQDLNPDLHLIDYAIWHVLKNKTNATSHSNICSLKTVIEEE